MTKLNAEQVELVKKWIEEYEKTSKGKMPIPSDVRKFLNRHGFDDDVINKVLSVAVSASQAGSQKDKGSPEKNDDMVVRGSDQYFGIDRVVDTFKDVRDMDPDHMALYNRMTRIVDELRGKDLRYLARELKRYTSG